MKNKVFIKDGNFYRAKTSFGDIIHAVELNHNMRAKMNARMIRFNLSEITFINSKNKQSP